MKVVFKLNIFSLFSFFFFLISIHIHTHNQSKFLLFLCQCIAIFYLPDSSIYQELPQSEVMNGRCKVSQKFLLSAIKNKKEKPVITFLSLFQCLHSYFWSGICPTNIYPKSSIKTTDYCAD